MSPKESSHLDDDQLLTAVVDEAELPASAREHLSECVRCLNQKAGFEQDLTRLGQLAQRFVPSSPKRHVSISLKEPRGPYWRGQGWRIGRTVAMATAAVVAGLWLSILFISSPERRMADLNQQMWEDHRLMTEISLLEENALPPVYFDIAGESYSDFDEEFMQFVVPSIDNEIRSDNLETRGTVLC